MEETPAPPQVSVLIVSYNSAGPLRRCLQALEGSAERERFEIVVVDAGSRDDSPTLDAEFPNATFLRLPRNFGFVKAANIAMRTAKGEFFFFLDPNIEVLPDTVSSLAAKLASEEEAVAVCPLLAGAAGNPEPQVRKLPDAAAVARAWRAGDWDPPAPVSGEERVSVEFPSLSAMMVRSYFLRGLRYIDERYGHSWAGPEICFQILRAGRKILLFPGIRALRMEESARVFPDDSRTQALLSADWILGAARYSEKRYGTLAGWKVRLTASLVTFFQFLASLARFRDVGFSFSRFLNVAGGQKLDGSQAGL